MDIQVEKSIQFSLTMSLSTSIILLIILLSVTKQFYRTSKSHFFLSIPSLVFCDWLLQSSLAVMYPQATSSLDVLAIMTCSAGLVILLALGVLLNYWESSQHLQKKISYTFEDMRLSSLSPRITFKWRCFLCPGDRETPLFLRSQ